MKILFIGSRLYDDVDFYVKQKGIESILTEDISQRISSIIITKSIPIISIIIIQHLFQGIGIISSIL